MTFVNSQPKKVLLFLSLIILSLTLSKAKNILKKNTSQTKDYNQEGLKKYYEMGLDIANFGDDQKKCWNFVWGAGYPTYKVDQEKFWATSIEPFIKSPSQEKLDLNTHLNTFINDKIGNNVLIDPTQNGVTCATYLNSKRKGNLSAEDIKKGAMAAFNIISPSKPPGPKLFVTSSVTTHRDIVANKDIFKVLNGNK